MTVARRIGDRLAQRVLLTRAHARARARSVEARAELRSLVQAIDRRLDGARRLELGPVAAIDVYREAFALCARALAVDEGVHGVELNPLAAVDGRIERGALTRPPRAYARVRALLGSESIVAGDALRFRDAVRARGDADLVLDWLRRQIDTRSALRLGLARAARVAGLAAVVGSVLVLGGVAIASGHDAKGRPVSVSSVVNDAGAPALVVDGKGCGRERVLTQVEPEPWIVVDLERERNVERVVVEGDGDAYVDETRALVLEVSRDGKSFVEAARRTTPLTRTQSWSVALGGEPVRWVRVKKLGKSDLTLCEIAVFD